MGFHQGEIMKYEVMIQPEDIQIFLNLLDGNINISYPIYGLDLIRAHVDKKGYTLKYPNKQELWDASDDFGSLKKEVPNFNDLRSCLLSSGVMSFKNLEEIKEEIKTYRNIKKSVKFSLDTNMLYFNFTLSHGLLDPSEIVLVKTVRDELMKVMNKKYRHEEILELNKKGNFDGRLLKELKNKRKKKSRNAKIALKEFKHLKGDAKVIEEKGDDPPDKRIVDSLAEYEKKFDTTIVLLTADDACVDLCEAENIAYIKCDIPNEIDEERCSFETFNKLVLNMASMLGLIKVGPFLVYGEYKGYSSNQPDLLKLKDSYKKRHDLLKKELKICKELREIGIKK